MNVFLCMCLNQVAPTAARTSSVEAEKREERVESGAAGEDGAAREEGAAREGAHVESSEVAPDGSTAASTEQSEEQASAGAEAGAEHVHNHVALTQDMSPALREYSEKSKLFEHTLLAIKDSRVKVLLLSSPSTFGLPSAALVATLGISVCAPSCCKTFVLD